MTFSSPRVGSHLAAAVALCSGIALFSMQDAIIKSISTSYPVHEALVIRSVTAVPILIVLVRLSGGLRGAGASILTARGAILLIAYTAYYLALPAMPLASAVTLWFTAPLFVAALSGLIAHEPAPRSAWLAILVGFVGVIVMVRPGGNLFHASALLPIASALAYAVAQLMARRLHVGISAQAMAFYQNAVYLVGAVVMAGVLQPFSGGGHNASLDFLLRAWSLPTWTNLALLSLCGPIAAFGSSLLSSAYRTAGSVVAPFEFSALVWATLWGAVFWDEFPGPGDAIGAALIVLSGIYAVLRLAR